MSRYLLIENRGVSSIDLMRIAGASTSRDNDDLIGQFGNGFDNALALLMREGCRTVMTLGTDSYELMVDETAAKNVKGGTKQIREVVAKQIGGNRRATQRLGFDESMGSVNWDDIGMALRELVSNALDASKELSGNYKEARVVMLDQEPTKWARDGFTRFYIQANHKVEEYHATLAEHFLMLGKKGFDRDRVVIEKPNPGPLRVYRKGVLVGHYPDMPSLYDYNINNLDVPESRKVTAEAAATEIVHAIKRMEPKLLARVLEAMAKGEDVYEREHISSYYLKLRSWESDDVTKDLKEKWGQACRMLFADDVVCTNEHEARQVVRQGRKAIVVSSTMQDVLKTYGVCTIASDILDSVSLAGRERVDIPKDILERAESLWATFGALKVTRDMPMPVIEGFRNVADHATRVDGYFDHVTLNVGLCEETFASHYKVFRALIEQFGRYITRDDNDTDITDWCLDVTAKAVLLAC